MRSAAQTAGPDSGSDAEFFTWLETKAEGFDVGAEPASILLPRLAAAGFAAAGVPAAAGGSGGDIVDGVVAIAAVAEQSLAAAFVLWGHRTYIEYLQQSPNKPLGDRLLPRLLTGRLAGASGLSNAMKFLAGMEPLQIAARRDGALLRLNGKMPWVTNLRPEGFHVAAAIDRKDGTPFVASLAQDDAGLTRSEDLLLLAMRSTNTAAISLADVAIGADRILHPDARAWLPQVRPAFTGLQCGMSIGLARRSLAEAKASTSGGRGVLSDPIFELGRQLDHAENSLFSGLRSRAFETKAAPLFELRIAFAEIVFAAVSLELQAAGGRAYLAGAGRDFARRWREAAFIPLVTPSLVQLKAALHSHAGNTA
jgi:alkylation response protein AidB-like acyl-CoA dehydrogenase